MNKSTGCARLRRAAVAPCNRQCPLGVSVVATWRICHAPEWILCRRDTCSRFSRPADRRDGAGATRRWRRAGGGCAAYFGASRGPAHFRTRAAFLRTGSAFRGAGGACCNAAFFAAFGRGTALLGAACRDAASHESAADRPAHRFSPRLDARPHAPQRGRYRPGGQSAEPPCAGARDPARRRARRQPRRPVGRAQCAEHGWAGTRRPRPQCRRHLAGRAPGRPRQSHPAQCCAHQSVAPRSGGPKSVGQHFPWAFCAVVVRARLRP